MNNPSRPRHLAAISTLTFVIAALVPQAQATEALLLQDAYVDNGIPFQTFVNYGSSGDLRVFKNGTRTMRSFLKFSLDTLPPGTTAANVVQARLRLWVSSSTASVGLVTITPITSSWDELAIRNVNSTGMTFGLPKLTSLPINSSSDFVSIDLTAWVKAWLAGTLANEGFAIEANPNVSSLDIYFDSKESSQTSHEPRLEVVLASIGPQGPIGPEGPRGSIGPQGPMGPSGPRGEQGPTGPTGATGARGQVGPAGIAGPEGPVGPAGLTWKGEWADSAAYVPGDVISFNGSTFVAIRASTNSQPPALDWELLAQKGAVGAAGPQGRDGPAGPTGLKGEIGPQGPAGPAGDPGPPGAEGPQGLQGPQGQAGPSAVWPTRILPQGDLSMGEFTQGPPP